MESNSYQETFVEQKVTYTLEFNEKFYIIENVPARVCMETGERFYSPETTEKLQQIIWVGKQPKKVIETPVYEFI